MMTRISLYVPDTLRYRLELAAKQTSKGLSEYAGELLDEALARERGQHLDEMYTAWGEVEGLVTGGPPDLASTVDEVLYGSDGAWRGETSKHGLWRIQNHDTKH
jgi:hypothetical protein